MDTINSFKGYGKVDPIEEQTFRCKTRRRIIIVSVSTVLLLAIIIGIVTGSLIHHRNSSSSSPSTSPTSPAAAIKAVCGVTQYPNSCFSSIQSLDNSSNSTSDPEQLFKLSLHVALNELSAIASFPQILISKINNVNVSAALSVCQTVMEDAIDHLDESISALDVSSGEKLISTAKIGDLKTWLSSTLTNQETCLDAIQEVNSTVSDSVLKEVNSIMKNSTEFTSNSLAIAAKLLGILSDLNLPVHRKLLQVSDSEFPSWMGTADRKLLQHDSTVVPNVTVAEDGSGDFKTIREALAKVPKKSKMRFVIYIKAGVYKENVLMDKSFQNVMMYGDGMYKTTVSGSLNFVDGTPTFSTATLAVVGKGFIARDMGFKNTAGPEKHQAVAMRSGSDLSAFYRCSFDAYQDTLYSHSNRQFYRDCDITGTIDFIFGNAAVVYQNCNIKPRQPLPNQFNTITAQGKKDINQNTGISIHKCTISPLDNVTAPTYLGRPWKDFSTTVIMQTNIASVLKPVGWISWVANVDPPSTIFYGEYQNSGPGSSVTGRVTWAGYRPSITSAQASQFSVLSFINGQDWLADTGVLYDSSLN